MNEKLSKEQLKGELVSIATDMENYYSAPGLPQNFISVISKDIQVIEGYNDFSVCENVNDIENAINNNLGALTLSNGIYCSGIFKGDFIRKRYYCEPTEILENTEADFEVNVEILKYVFGVISVVADLENKIGENEIYIIYFSGEAGMASMERFDTLNECKNCVYNEWEIEHSNE